MIFRIKKYERKIFELISDCARELDYPTYVVGGYVRDRLLGRPSKDMDIVCVGSGIKLAQKLSEKLRPIPRLVVYQRFGTAMIKHQDLEIEFVGARKESYRADSRKPAVESGSLEDDQNRRDFTINALAVSLNDHDFGCLIDPFDGLIDLERKIIRTPLEPGRTFSDDPLRMLRAIRFATQLDFEITSKTYRAISECKSRITIISKERISTELNKIILCEQPSRGFKMLEETGLLPFFFPEMQALKGVEIKNGIGHKDNFYHTLEVLDNISEHTDNLWLRWAAILHDIAKPATKRFNDQQGWTFHGHEVVGTRLVEKIFKRLRLPLDHKMKYVQKLVRLHLRPIALTKKEISDSAVRRLLFDAGDDIDDLMTLCRADITSKNEKKVERYLQNYDKVVEKLKEVEEKDHLRNWEPPISGEVIMNYFNIKPSRQVGEIKTAIREAILEGEIPNEYDRAFEFMKEIGQQIGVTTES
ncbi:CCA tRNA nucleotidyltransferase [Portibacter marinus]|uniref:CCA tRNA nucleotidyltransferase n=1 Tax=Portibacter marinus TaxID=2898660 RepID=UPI001F34F505|nr:HD domain-containing protein [Portibacter marinus]